MQAEAAARGPDIRVILNAGSGKQRGAERAAELKAMFDRWPGRFDLCLVKSGHRIEGEARRAVEEGFRTVVAAGGDGTICAVASAVAGSKSRMGVLSQGTFNYFSRSLGLPEALEDAVAVLVEGEERAIDVGEVNGRVFLNNASLGAYASILEQREDVYRRWGRSRAAAFWSVILTLARFRHPMVLKVTVDGEVLRARTPLAFVANNAYQLEEFQLDGAERVRNGEFALFLAPDSSRIQLITFAGRLALRRMVADRDFQIFFGREILIETTRPTRLVARDGERERMAAPFRFHVRHGALRVLVPAGVG